jgi:hypothetical protein
LPSRKRSIFAAARGTRYAALPAMRGDGDGCAVGEPESFTGDLSMLTVSPLESTPATL